MDKQPAISIIVPVYKAEAYLHRCVDSLLVQTFADFEILLIDDGSPDRSGRICDEYAKKDPRIRVFHKENGGVSSARNLGIEHAVGDWICFIDSDDTIDKTYLEDFELNKVYADIYMQGYVKKKGNNIVEQHHFANCKSKDFFSILAYTEDNQIINSPCFKLYKRSVIVNNKLHFDTNTSYGEDHLFSLSYIIHCESVHYSLGIGYVYRINGIESLTQRIVPFQEITYYALQAKKYHDYICKRSVGDDYLSSIGLTYMTNYVRALKYLFKANGSYEDFKWIRNSYLPNLERISIKKLSLKYKILRQFSLFSIPYMLYYCISKMLKNR